MSQNKTPDVAPGVGSNPPSLSHCYGMVALELVTYAVAVAKEASAASKDGDLGAAARLLGVAKALSAGSMRWEERASAAQALEEANRPGRVSAGEVIHYMQRALEFGSDEK